MVIIGVDTMGLLSNSPPPSIRAIRASLVNDLSALPDGTSLVLDDFHAAENAAIGETLRFLLQHLPANLHIVISTRVDPQIPLGRLRALDQLIELRAPDLRFTRAEAGAFLNQAMALRLEPKDVAILEERSEGWIAGLQLAAISLRKHGGRSEFTRDLSGSQRHIADYLVEEVFNGQPDDIQRFLQYTSVLDRLCGPLCDAILEAPSGTGQRTLEYLEHANLFTISLDDERRWYRYHHLLTDILRHRAENDDSFDASRVHRRASVWFEANGMEIDAFQHAARANHIPRAGRLLEGRGVPLHFRGAVRQVLAWLEGLPEAVFDNRPALSEMYASE